MLWSESGERRYLIIKICSDVKMSQLNTMLRPILEQVKPAWNELYRI